MKIPRAADSKIENRASRSTILDALRAVAILLVLGRHTYINQTLTRIGWCGVDLFFVISGFLISGLLFQEYKRFGSIRLKTFWLRRGLKIYPAFYVYTLVTALLYPTVFHWTLSVRHVLADAAFFSSYTEGLSGHTWSLAVEEHFYIFLPLLLLLLIKIRPNKQNPFAAIPVIFGLLATASLLFRMAAKPAFFTDYYKFMFPTHMRIDALFCGVTIGYLFHFRPRILARIADWKLLTAGAILLTPIYFIEVPYPWMYTWGLTCTYFGFACLLTWAVHQRPPQGKLAALPINLLAKIGFYSYSIYLWHWLIIEDFGTYLRHKCISTGHPFAWSPTLQTRQWPVLVVLSIVIGIAMAKIVEVPVLKLRDQWFPSRTRPSDLTNQLKSDGELVQPPRAMAAAQGQ